MNGRCLNFEFGLCMLYIILSSKLDTMLHLHGIFVDCCYSRATLCC